MATWEAHPKLAVNLNPKVAWSGSGNLWGMGLSANVQLAPRWQLVPETNLVANNLRQSNGTLGLRWSATDSVAVETYISTAASILDIGQLLSADRVRWGGRLLVSFDAEQARQPLVRYCGSLWLVTGAQAECQRAAGDNHLIKTGQGRNEAAAPACQHESAQRPTAQLRRFD